MDILLLSISFLAVVFCVTSLWLFAALQKAKGKLAIAIARLGEQRTREELIDALKDHTVHAAKSAALEAGQQLSSKLLDDHKRENEAARELHSKATKQITETLMQQAQVMNDKLASLHDGHQKQAGELATVMNALTNPTGAGKIAEIGLENLLKSFGLEAGRDFETQFSMSTTQGRLKPDAVVYLPQNRIIVIDCKASKFLMDDTADEALKQTMSKHLRDLANKDYRAAITADYKKIQGTEPLEVLSVMYVPTESLAQRAKDIDAGFADNLMKADIILASPASLHGLLSFARMQIINEKQIANSEKIVEAASQLLDGIITAFGHVEKLANSLKASMGHFNAFATSANSSIINRAQKFSPLGVLPSKGKSLPGQLPRYEVIGREAAEIVEFELVEHKEKSNG